MTRSMRCPPARWLPALMLGVYLLGPAPAAAELRVVATLPDLAALAAAVGGDDVEVTALAPPNQDPHYVDPRPNLILPLNRADLLIVNGLELEVGWLPPLQVAARNGRIQAGGSGYFDASAVVRRLEVPTGKIDRAMGDVHPGGNPHFLYDPRQARRVVAALAAHMGRLDPGNAADYARRAAAFDARLAALAGRQAARFGALSAAQRRVVTYHASLTYLFDWLDVEAVQTVEPRPGIPPTPAHTAQVLSTMKARDVRRVVQESFYPRKTSETLARLVDGAVVVLPGSTRFDEGEGYLTHMNDIAERLYDALAK